MLTRVIRVTPLPGYRLLVEPDDGVSGIIDLAGELTGPVFEPLRDEAVFRQVTIDDYGAVGWRNGPGLAPDAMHDEAVGQAPVPSSPSPERMTDRPFSRSVSALPA